MAEQIGSQVEDQTGKMEIDSWEAAFAALEQKAPADPEKPADTDGGDAGSQDQGTQPVGGTAIPDQIQAADGSGDEGIVGGSGAPAGGADQEIGGTGESLFDVSVGDIGKYKEEVENRVRDQAVREIAAEFVKRGVRNRNGVLGASMDDKDVCKRDEDGVPHFYNPETGQEFRGDNPRRQAQEWVDDYNKELRRVFNEACEGYEKHLMEQEAPKLKVLEFAPKYDKLDDIRKGMFDNVIQDYEIRDKSGNIIGYDCDLDKALALVERQISMIQEYAKSHKQEQKPQPTGPALDMKTSSGAVDPSGEPPKSLEEAMLRIQEQQLAKMRK